MKAPRSATLSEVELLTKVNSPISATVQARYSTLIERRQAEALTPEEHQELLDLTEQIEQIDAQRAEYLAALARIRHVPVAKIMTDLGIDHPIQHG